MIPVPSSKFETIDVSSELGGYKATGAGLDLDMVWVFEQTAVNYADTFNDFAGTQGFRAWYYGYTTDPSNPAAFSTASMFYPTTELGHPHWGRSGGLANTPWLDATGQQPPAISGTQAFAVRRWISDIAGLVWFMGFGKGDAASITGEIFSIRKNGAIIHTRTVAPFDSSSEKVIVSVSVAEGDFIDFVVDTRTGAGSDVYWGDFYIFKTALFSGSQSGIVHSSSIWKPPVTFTGQAAMIQGNGRFYQVIDGPEGRVSIKAKVMATDTFTLQVKFDDVLIHEQTVDYADFTWIETPEVDWPIGEHKITFQGYGPIDEEMYFSEVKLPGMTSVLGEDVSDSEEDSEDPSRGRSQSETSESIELACRNVIYNRSESEEDDSEEARGLDIDNPYDPDINPNDDTIGVLPGVGITPVYGRSIVETSESVESYTLYKNNVLVQPVTCENRFAQRILSTFGLLAYWRVNHTSGTVTTDSGPYALHGANDPTLTLNVPGAVIGDSAIEFQTGKILVPWSSRFQQAVFSIELWFRTDATATEQALVYMQDDGGTHESIFNLSVAVGGTAFIGVRGSEAVFYSASGPNVADGKWHHFVLTSSGSMLRGYIDGVQFAAVATPAGVTLVQASPTPIAFGKFRQNWLAIEGYQLDGALDEIAMYSRVLTPTEVVDHYELGAIPLGTDYVDMVLALPNLVSHWRIGENTSAHADSAGVEDGTSSGAVTLAAPGAILRDTDRAIIFNAGEVTVPKNAAHELAEFTLLAWIRPTLIAGAERIIIINQDGGDDRNYTMYLVNASSRLSGGFNTGPAAYTNYVTGGVVPLNVWTMAALTFDGANLRIYNNGIETDALATAATPSTPATAVIRIGRYNAGLLPFKGKIDEVSIIDGALTADQILSLYRRGIGL